MYKFRWFIFTYLLFSCKGNGLFKNSSLNNKSFFFCSQYFDYNDGKLLLSVFKTKEIKKINNKQFNKINIIYTNSDSVKSDYYYYDSEFDILYTITKQNEIDTAIIFNVKRKIEYYNGNLHTTIIPTDTTIKVRGQNYCHLNTMSVKSITGKIFYYYLNSNGVIMVGDSDGIFAYGNCKS